MRREKRHLTEKILNHALGIIYLLTGEEYVIVKKNSPHNASHLLAGEMPVKCGDISIYFSMDEWDFIEEHRELYQDVTLQNPKDHSSEVLADIIQDYQRDDWMDDTFETIQHEEMFQGNCTDLFMAKQNGALNNGREGDDTNENDILQVEIDSQTCSDEYYPNHVSNDGQAKELLVRSCDQETHGDAWIVHPNFTGEFIDRTIPEESYSVTCSSNGLAEEDISFFHGFPEDNSSPANESNIAYQQVNEKCEQISVLLKENLIGVDHEESNEEEQSRLTNTEKCSEKVAKSKSPVSNQMPHVEEKVHHCGECGKYFDYKSNLIRHQRTHTGEKPYSCDECDKRYATKSHLTIHKRTHLSGKPHRCDQCGKHFTYKSQITMHQRTHTGEKPHTCSLCGKNFAYKSYLIIHQRIHSGERPHMCPQCGKCFTDKSNLRKHQNTHTENKPFVCKECGKHFNSKYSYTTHQRTHQRAKSK
ncbi:oocyte zinc finger protein XlCOF7.1-like [Gastrophryne carolinensis]